MLTSLCLIVCSACGKKEEPKVDPNSITMNIGTEDTNYDPNDESTYAVVDDGTTEEFSFNPDDKVHFQAEGSNKKKETEEESTPVDSVLTEAKNNRSKIQLPDNYHYSVTDMTTGTEVDVYRIATGEQYVKYKNTNGTLEYASYAGAPSDVNFQFTFTNPDYKSYEKSGKALQSMFTIDKMEPAIKEINAADKQGINVDLDCSIYLGANSYDATVTVNDKWIIQNIKIYSDRNVSIKLATILSPQKTANDFHSNALIPDEQVQECLNILKGQTVTTPTEQPTPSATTTQDYSSHGQFKESKSTDFDFDSAGQVSAIIVTRTLKYDDGCVLRIITKKSPDGTVLSETQDDSGMKDHSGDATPTPSASANPELSKRPEASHYQKYGDTYFVEAKIPLNENVSYNEALDTLNSVYNNDSNNEHYSIEMYDNSTYVKVLADCSEVEYIYIIQDAIEDIAAKMGSSVSEWE